MCSFCQSFSIIPIFIEFLTILVVMFATKKAIETKSVQTFFKKEEDALSDIFFKYTMMVLVASALLVAVGILTPVGILLFSPHGTWGLPVAEAAGNVMIYSFITMIAIGASFGPSNNPFMFTGLERECFGHCTCRCHHRYTGGGPL